LLNAVECEQNLLYDTSTGSFPYIHTTSIFQYSCPDNVWLVKHVVVDNDATLSTGDWRLEPINFEGNDYYRVLNIKTIPARTVGNYQIVPATIQFRGINPGNSTSLFKRISYKLPVNITNQNIQHECPSPEAEQILIQATMSLIDAINDHKKQLVVTKYINEILKPQYWGTLNQGEQGIPSFCVKRKF
jgi:hypothetical protein